VNKIDKEK